MASEPGAAYDELTRLDGSRLAPVVTWGINPGQAIGVDERIPTADTFAVDEREVAEDAYAYMDWTPGAPIAGTKIDVAFIGSCTNSRLSDLREAAAIVKGHTVSPRVRAMVVPGSQGVSKAAIAEGLDQIFRDAGFEWRGAGCSMCLGMNPDKLQGAEMCASSSNRNFKGRQGSPTGRTLLMSPAMVAAAAIAGEVVDVRKVLAPALAGR
jgi:3-isopropylmalate/(R)-2-methylmalate dehydratase large subunit